MGKYRINKNVDAQRIHLLMNYDPEKTLVENNKIINEWDTNRTAAAGMGAAGGAALGAGAGAAVTSGALGYGGAAMATGGAAMSIGNALGATGLAAGALGGAVLGGAAALAVVPLAYWLITKDTNAGKVKRIFNYCVQDIDKINKIPKKLSDVEIRNLSDQLYDALNGLGTDEEQVYAAFNSLQTASDFCSLVVRFNRDNGDLYEWLDDDFDSPSEWDKIYRPIRNVVEDTLLSIKDDTGGTDPNGPNPPGGGGGGTGGYKPCPGPTFTQGCYNETIKQLQSCLGGLVSDGKFGPKTFAAIKAKIPTFDGNLTQEIFDEIMKSCNSNSGPAVPGKGIMPHPTFKDIEMPKLPYGLDNPKKVQTPAAPAAVPASTPEQTYHKYRTLIHQRPQKFGGAYIYKGNDLPPDDLNKLNQYFAGKGFTQTKADPTKDYGAKYAWKK